MSIKEKLDLFIKNNFVDDKPLFSRAFGRAKVQEEYCFEEAPSVTLRTTLPTKRQKLY